MITQAEMVNESKKVMEDEIKAFSKKNTVKVIGSVNEGYTLDIILGLPADLIVMGMKGRGKSNSVFGSTTSMLSVIQLLLYLLFL